MIGRHVDNSCQQASFCPSRRQCKHNQDDRCARATTVDEGRDVFWEKGGSVGIVQRRFVPPPKGGFAQIQQDQKIMIKAPWAKEEVGGGGGVRSLGRVP